MYMVVKINWTKDKEVSWEDYVRAFDDKEEAEDYIRGRMYIEEDLDLFNFVIKEYKLVQ